MLQNFYAFIDKDLKNSSRPISVVMSKVYGVYAAVTQSQS